MFADRLLRRLAAVAEPAVELAHQLLGGVGDHRAGRENRLGAGLAHGVVTELETEAFLCNVGE